MKASQIRTGKASGRALALAKQDLGATVAAHLLALAEEHRTGDDWQSRTPFVYAENVLAVAGIPTARIPVLCKALRRGTAGTMDWRKELGLAKGTGAKAIIASFPEDPSPLV